MRIYGYPHIVYVCRIQNLQNPERTKGRKIEYQIPVSGVVRFVVPSNLTSENPSHPIPDSVDSVGSPLIIRS